MVNIEERGEESKFPEPSVYRKFAGATVAVSFRLPKYPLSEIVGLTT